MSGSILVAGIGNIFQGDDAFGVAVVQRLSAIPLPDNVRVMDVGIRAIDLAFALLDSYEAIILVDATQRGGVPGTLYMVEIGAEDIPEICEDDSIVNSHGLDPVRVLSLARCMGARLENILLIGCEPQTLDCDDTGHIGLSEPVAAAVDSAARWIQQFAFEKSDRTEEVLHDYR
jgi:hydrogenase maturation protease